MMKWGKLTFDLRCNFGTRRSHYWLTDHTIFINSVLLNNLKSAILFMQDNHIEIKDKFTFNSCIRNLLIFLILRTMIYSSPTMSPIILFYKFEAYFTTFSLSPVNCLILNNC